MITVLIADDFEPMRRIMPVFFHQEKDIQVLSLCGTSLEVIEFLENKPTPDVLVISERLFAYWGIEYLQKVPSLRVIVTAMNFNQSFIEQVRELGACSFVLKSCFDVHLVSAVRAAHRGEWYLGLSVS
jgi:DNA-binding NarL/FixJ family response regulator